LAFIPIIFWSTCMELNRVPDRTKVDIIRINASSALIKNTAGGFPLSPVTSLDVGGLQSQ